MCCPVNIAFTTSWSIREKSLPRSGASPSWKCLELTLVLPQEVYSIHLSHSTCGHLVVRRMAEKVRWFTELLTGFDGPCNWYGKVHLSYGNVECVAEVRSTRAYCTTGASKNYRTLKTGVVLLCLLCAIQRDVGIQLSSTQVFVLIYEKARIHGIKKNQGKTQQCSVEISTTGREKIKRWIRVCYQEEEFLMDVKKKHLMIWL